MRQWGPECGGGGEDQRTYAKKYQWLQLIRDIGCQASCTWGDTHGDDACTFMGWGWTAVRKQLDNIVGPRGMKGGVMYINKERMRGWDAYPVIMRFSGRRMKYTDRAKRKGNS